jgi:alpha-mannosidase
MGESFGPSFATHWFKVQLSIPAEWSKEEVHLLWDSASEALVWSAEGKPLQGLNGSDGCDRRSEMIVQRPGVTSAVAAVTSPSASASAVAHTFTYFVEMACNGCFGTGSNDMIAAPDPNRQFTLRQCELAVFDREYWDLYFDFHTVMELAKDLPKEVCGDNSSKSTYSTAALRALRAANEVLNTVQPRDAKSWGEARRLLQTCLSHPTASSSSAAADNKQNHSQPIVYATGHCHIDTAWLWPYAETRRKTARSWATQLRYMQQPEYKGYKFTASQAQQ